MYLGHQNIFQLSIIWLAVFHLKIISVKHLATVNFFFFHKDRSSGSIEYWDFFVSPVICFPSLQHNSSVFYFVLLSWCICSIMWLFLFFDSYYSFCLLALSFQQLYQINPKLYVLASSFCTPDFQIIAGNKCVLCCDFLCVRMI